MNLYREKKYANSLYKCTIITDTNVADTVTPSQNCMEYLKIDYT